MTATVRGTRKSYVVKAPKGDKPPKGCVNLAQNGKSASERNKYANRPSPPYGANECCGKVMKGNDGAMWESKENSRGICAWKKNESSKKKVSRTSGKNYFIHDNGGRPFMVNVDGRKVKVYKFTSKDIEADDPEQYQKLIKEFDVEQYFIGEDDSVNTKFGEGNSILLELDDGVYVYIGSEIYQFEPDDQILEYHSTIGNSDVPYPITLGEENAYFMLDGKYIPLKELEGIDVSEMYGEFYQNKSLKSFKMKGKKMIQKR
jgi:hypothetical protein